MTPKELAHEFFLGIRTAMTCPDVSVAEYEGVIAYKIEKSKSRTGCSTNYVAGTATTPLSATSPKASERGFSHDTRPTKRLGHPFLSQSTHETRL